MTSRNLALSLSVVGIVGAAALTLTSTASASTGLSVQDQINAQLREFPGGVQSGPNEVSYKGGKVTVTFPAQGAASITDTCWTGGYCFYDGPNLSGRKLSFKDCGGTQYLTDYGFGNKTSSWSNRSRNTVEVFDEDVQPWKLLWTENPGAASSNVGTAAYNKADFFTTYCPS